jgi:hypothetical protein
MVIKITAYTHYMKEAYAKDSIALMLACIFNSSYYQISVHLQSGIIVIANWNTNVIRI